MDLSTNYLGLRLNSPLVAGASPLSRDLDTARRLEDAGASALVMYSLFQEQIDFEINRHHHFEEFASDVFAEAQTFGPRLDYFPRTMYEYVDHLSKVKSSSEIPIIASLNGHTLGGWIHYARTLQQAGADAIELNIYHIETNPSVSAADVEKLYLDIVAGVREEVRIPIAVKLSPYFSALVGFAVKLNRIGADGLVLFNRFYQPDIDIESLDVVPDLSLSAPHEMRLPLRWIAILDPLVDCSLAASTGVYHGRDVLKLVMAGADVVMLCSTLLRHGIDSLARIQAEMIEWMHEHEYLSLHQMHGCMNHRTCDNPAAFERANYMKALNSYL